MPDTAQSTGHLWLQNYGDKLYAFALARVGGDAALAEDLVQETLLAGLKGFDSFSQQSSVETWLFSILRRKIVDHYRKQGRRGKEFAYDDFFSDHGSIKNLSDWRFDAEQLLADKEFIDTVKGCMSQLSTPLKEAFQASVIDELETEEACRLLGISSTNLSVRLHRARLAVRRCLEIKWFED